MGEDLLVLLVDLKPVYVDIFLLLSMPVTDISLKRQAFSVLMTLSHATAAYVFISFTDKVLTMPF